MDAPLELQNKGASLNKRHAHLAPNNLRPARKGRPPSLARARARASRVQVVGSTAEAESRRASKEQAPTVSRCDHRQEVPVFVCFLARGRPPFLVPCPSSADREVGVFPTFLQNRKREYHPLHKKEELWFPCLSSGIPNTK